MHHQASLLLSCPDKKGIVAAVSHFLLQQNANILESDQYQDNQSRIFFMRVVFDTTDVPADKEVFLREFQVIAGRFQMQWEMHFSDEKKRVALLVSKENHCLADILYRYTNHELDCGIPLIISNHETSRKLADFYGIPFLFFPITKDTKHTVEKEMLKVLQTHAIDVVVLARYMQILSSHFIETLSKPIINIHHLSNKILSAFHIVIQQQI